MFGRAKRVRVQERFCAEEKKGEGWRKKEIFNTVVAQGKRKERKKVRRKEGDKPGKFMDPGSIYFHNV